MTINRLAYHLWSLSRDENVLRTALIICLTVAGFAYLSAGISTAPDTTAYNSQQSLISADGLMRYR